MKDQSLMYQYVKNRISFQWKKFMLARQRLYLNTVFALISMAIYMISQC